MVSSGSPKERLEQAHGFLEFFSSEGLTHFREEEEVLFPEVMRHINSIPDSLTQALMDHVRIHSLVRTLREEVESGDVTAEIVIGLGEALEQHIRMEEGILFPEIEKVLGEPNLANLHFSDRDRTKS